MIVPFSTFNRTFRGGKGKKEKEISFYKFSCTNGIFAIDILLA